MKIMAKTKPVAKKKTVATKKPVTKKAAPKKTAAKKLAAKKTTTKKTTAAKKTVAKAKAGTIPQKFLKGTGKPSTKRPPNNPDMPWESINLLNIQLGHMKDLLDNYSQHLRALDRRRLNGVGIKKLGFIERAFELASESSEFLPHYLTLERFDSDIQYFLAFQSLCDLTKQIQEKLWNITLQSADIAYTDALEFYASVREAAKRRVDAAETIFRDLSVFFKRRRTEGSEPTEKQLKKDFNSLLHSRKDGKLIIENIKPKLSGGKHKVIDETFKDTARFKETEEGEFSENN